mgnify:CR=1 FL=1
MERYIFDLSDRSFQKFAYFPDAPDAIASFDIPEVLPEQISISVRGLYLIDPNEEPSLHPYLSIQVCEHAPSALYLSEWGTLTFNKVHGGELSIFRFQSPTQPGQLELMTDDSGSHVRLSRQWPFLCPESSSKYELSMVLENPLGHMHFTIYASGPVTLSVDPLAFVAEEEVDEFPDRYLYDWPQAY